MLNTVLALAITGACVFLGGMFGYNYGYSRAVDETAPIVVERTRVVYAPCVQLAEM